MRPIVLASGNGLPACRRAFDLLKSGVAPLAAVVAGVALIEDDPDDHSVGFGGLPNAEGVVELDAVVMDGPTHRAGAVAALRHVRHAAQVALRVLERSPHVLLVGAGALAFARTEGFIEEELLTADARRMWEHWRSTQSATDGAWHYPTADRVPPLEPGFRAPAAPGEAPEFKPGAATHRKSGAEPGRKPGAEPGPVTTHGTVTVLAVAGDGAVAGCTSTSGLSYKLPGRVGDSAIVGAGLYVDNAVGACGATGHGELSLRNCACFQVVELLRQGHTPEEACRETLRRVFARLEPALRNEHGGPAVELNLFALRADGAYGGARLREDGWLTVADETGARREPVAVMAMLSG